MPQTIRIETKGLRELGLEFQKLAADMQKKVARNATRAAAVVILKAAKERVPVDSGDLKSALTVWRSVRDSQPIGKEIFRVGVRKVKRKYSNTTRNRRMNRVGKKYSLEGAAYYWRFLEFGTVKMSAKPFFRPAFDQNKTKASDALIEKLRAGIGKLR